MKAKPVPRADRVLNYWKREKLAIVCIVFFGLTFNISMVLGPVWQGKLIDAIASGKPFPVVAFTALSFIAIIVMIQTLRYFKRFYIRIFSNSTSLAMRRAIYRNIMNEDALSLEGENVGNLMTRAISDVDLCVEGMRKFTTELFDTGVLLGTYLVTLLAYDARITLVSVILIPVAMLLAQKLKKVIYRYTIAWRAKNSEIADLTWTNLEHSMLYRIRGLEDDNAKRYGIELEDLRKKAVLASILENSMQPVYNVIAMLGVFFVIVAGGQKAISGAWSVGQFSAYITIFVATAFKASKASTLFNSVQKSQISWKRIKPYLEGDIPAAEPDGESGGARPNETVPTRTYAENNTVASAVTAILSVSNLSFRYGDEGDRIIDNISFTGRAGEIIGVTGSVACGKSTLALALTGAYPYAGSILVNGRELRDYCPDERAEKITWMGHHSDLLSDSIKNNILLGEKGDIMDVLNDVCFIPDLESMDEGVETRVGSDGVRLSGGQQSRIALARALFGKKSVIILDDPFSAVDVKTEKKIIENIKAHYRQSLILLVSHRLTVFPETDRIILLHGGSSSEYGTHAELMKESSLYKRIFSLQRAGNGAIDEA